MVKVPEIVPSTFCDFCVLPEKFENTKSGKRQKDLARAYFQCTLCKRDLCSRHCFMITIPRDYTAAEEPGEAGEFWRSLCATRSQFGDGKICVECSHQPLGKLGLLLLRALKKQYAEEKRFYNL